MNIYSILADLVVAIHLMYMGYIVFGQLAILIGWPLRWKWIRNPWFRVSHLGMILIVVFEAVMGYECPLTGWERDLRIAAGQTREYVGAEWQGISFTGRLMRKVQFAGLHHWEEHIDTVFYVAGGIIVGTLILVPPRLRRRRAAPPAPPSPEPPTATAAVAAIAPGAPPELREKGNLA